MFLQNFILVLLSLYLIEFATADSHGDPNDCATVKESDKCPNKMETVYLQTGGSNVINRFCCVPGTLASKFALLDAYQCQTTGCQNVWLTSNKCSTDSQGDVYRTWVNGSVLEYEEIMEEECHWTDGNGQIQTGTDIICCVENYKDIWLKSVLGAEPHQFPHSVYIQAGDDMCGGTVYNERYIITASHCVVDESTHKTLDKSTITVYLGSDMLVTSTGDHYGIEEIHVHPNSSELTGSDPLIADVAVLRVDRDIRFSSKVMALPLTDKDLEPLDYADHAVILGFGETDTVESSYDLLRGNTLLRSSQTNLGGNGPYSDIGMTYAPNYLFLGGYQDGVPSVSTGKGDSGGPAVCRDKDGYAMLCGVNSMGGLDLPCEENKDEESCTPKVFVRLSTFRDWITGVAGDQSKAVVLRQPLYGKVVSQGAYTHQVHITTEQGQSCGGTLISDDVVITAAHCVTNDDGSKKQRLRVQVGVRDLDKTLKGNREFQIKKIKTLKGFQRVGKSSARQTRVAIYAVKPTSQDSFFRNDIALLKLRERVDISSTTLPKLNGGDPREGGNTWGVEVALPLNSNKNRVLSEREFHILSQSDCQTRINRLKGSGIKFILEDNVLCGEEKYTGGSLCDRELGGGLFCKGSNGEEVLCGVQTYRMCDFAIPTAYFNVQKEKNWIEQQLQKW